LGDGETSGDDIESSKPDPDLFHAVVKCLRPSEAVALGDTPCDASAAAKAGIRCIGLLCGGFPEEDLPAAGCIAIFRDPAGRLANYERSPLTAHRAVPEEPAA
jgi:phosphoglycolate phosphatase-like HAD superfamily hydrolase